MEVSLVFILFSSCYGANLGELPVPGRRAMIADSALLGAYPGRISDTDGPPVNSHHARLQAVSHLFRILFAEHHCSQPQCAVIGQSYGFI